jgi:hypothetical protein
MKTPLIIVPFNPQRYIVTTPWQTSVTRFSDCSAGFPFREFDVRRRELRSINLDFELTILPVKAKGT